MRMKSAGFLAVSTVVLLSSCVSAPRAPTPAMELFDSKAVHEHVVSVLLPDPFLPVLADLAASSESRTETSPAAAPEASRPARPSEQASILSWDSGPAGTIRLRPGTVFALAAPAPPAQVILAAPAAKQAPLRQSGPAPAAAVSAPPAAGVPHAVNGPAAVSTAPAASAPLPASSPVHALAAPAAPAAPSTSGSPAGTYGRLREIYARQGDVLQVGLDGIGFLFLGLPDRQADGVSLKTKENRNNKTWFTFQAIKLGTYDLDFLQQDNLAGKSTRETVRVHVVSDQDFNAAVAPQQGQDSGEPGSTELGDPAFAQKLAGIRLVPGGGRRAP